MNTKYDRFSVLVAMLLNDDEYGLEGMPFEDFKYKVISLIDPEITRLCEYVEQSVCTRKSSDIFEKKVSRLQVMKYLAGFSRYVNNKDTTGVPSLSDLLIELRDYDEFNTRELPCQIIAMIRALCKEGYTTVAVCDSVHPLIEEYVYTLVRNELRGYTKDKITSDMLTLSYKKLYEKSSSAYKTYCDVQQLIYDIKNNKLTDAERKEITSTIRAKLDQIQTKKPVVDIDAHDFSSDEEDDAPSGPSLKIKGGTRNFDLRDTDDVYDLQISTEIEASKYNGGLIVIDDDGDDGDEDEIIKVPDNASSSDDEEIVKVPTITTEVDDMPDIDDEDRVIRGTRSVDNGLTHDVIKLDEEENHGGMRDDSEPTPRMVVDSEPTPRMVVDSEPTPRMVVDSEPIPRIDSEPDDIDAQVSEQGSVMVLDELVSEMP